MATSMTIDDRLTTGCLFPSVNRTAADRAAGTRDRLAPVPPFDYFLNNQRRRLVEYTAPQVPYRYGGGRRAC